MSAERDALVTGIGMVSALGIGVEPTWEALLAGRTGTVPTDSDEARIVGCPAQAVVQGFKGKDFVANRKSLKLMTRQVQLGMAAAKLAVEHGRVDHEALDPERFGVFVGAGQAFADSAELEPALDAARDASGRFDIVKFGAEALPLIHPLWLLRGLSNNVLGFVSLEYNAQGINNNYCNSGISSAQAILSAAHAIREGLADIVLAGGYDAIANAEGLLGYGRLGLLASSGVEPARAHRPFDRRRSGLVPAEGACFLVLESREHASRRGAAPIARVRGGGVASDGYTVSDPDPAGGKLRRAIRAALRDVNATAADVGAVFTHGASSRRYDAVEARAWIDLLGGLADRVPVCADKAAIGHTVAAEAAMSAGLACLAIQRQIIPPIATLDELDPECAGLAYVREQPAPFEGGLVFSASAGLGGQAAVLVLDAAPPEA